MTDAPQSCEDILMPGSLPKDVQTIQTEYPTCIISRLKIYKAGGELLLAAPIHIKLRVVESCIRSGEPCTAFELSTKYALFKKGCMPSCFDDARYTLTADGETDTSKLALAKLVDRPFYVVSMASRTDYGKQLPKEIDLEYCGDLAISGVLATESNKQ